MEILVDLKIEQSEESLLDMHSLLNVLNVVQFELYTMAEHLDDAPLLINLCDIVASAASQLSDPEKSRLLVETIDEFIDQVHRVLFELKAEMDLREDVEFLRSMSNLANIFKVLRVQAAELLARGEDPMLWSPHSIVQLKDDFLNLLHGIEQNSKGAYRIVYNLAEHEKTDYLVHFDITGVDKDSITMPPVFQDVMRDLLANARKYTKPGGRIMAGLHQSQSELRFIVADSGCGVPAGEIENVVLFGERGSNVLDHPTRGGGFGLTKAYFLTRRFNGRMWIDSPAENGYSTSIEIRIPLPSAGV